MPFISNISFNIKIFFFLLALFFILKTGLNLFLSYRKLFKKNTESIQRLHVIEKLHPLVFIKLLSNSLYVVFFPHYLLVITKASHAPAYVGTLIYVTYLICVVLMMLPSGYLVEVKPLKRLLFVMTFIEACLLLAFFFAQSIWVLLLLQIIFGCIYPISSSVEYAYVLQYSDQTNRTQALAAYSNTLRGAVITGVIFGGLLSSCFGERNVFFVGAILIFVALFYILFLIPRACVKEDFFKKSNRLSINFKTVLKRLPRAIKSPHFLKVLLCVGLPLGILHEGVYLFSLPLILLHHHIQHAWVGFLMVLFSLGFFSTNRTLAKYLDKHQHDRWFMFVGLVGIAICLSLLAFSALSEQVVLSMNLIGFVVGLFGLGLFKSFLLSPGSAYISKHVIGLNIGKNVSLSLYRLFRFFGSILGPLLLGFLFIYFNYSFKVYFILAIIFLLFGIILITDVNKFTRKM